jgi:UDP-N-acetylglucosamine:LPS N-acetylglucosamine transferase
VGHGVEILEATTPDEYFDRFDALVARTDALWTKPSELSFYAALGLPLVFAPPVGVHERYNRRWVQENGAGVRQRDTAFARQWIGDWLEDGTLAAAAWSGFWRLPKHGLHRILDEVDRPRGGPGQGG